MQSMEKVCERIKSPINIHSQISAMIVRRVNDVCKKDNVKVMLKKAESARLVPANSMLSMITFFASEGDDIDIIVEGDNCISSMEEIKKIFLVDLKKVNDESGTYELLKNTSIAYEEIFNSIAVGIIATDDNGIITIFNKASEKITGFSLDKAIGKNISEVMTDIDVSQVLKYGSEFLNKKYVIVKRRFF